MQKEELTDRFSVHYEGLISEFAKKIGHLDYSGMPEPHIPIIGSSYSKCKYKIAFYGIETAGWHDMSEFMKVAKVNPKAAATLHSEDLENQTCLQWTNNTHTSFWDFIITFVASFYHVDPRKVRNGEYPELIRSIIWGDTNSIEKYGLQAADNEVPIEVYNAIKEQSRIFDNSEHLINIAKPNVVIVLNWGEGEDWFVREKTNCQYYAINDHLWYYYNRSTQTHIFQTHHPRSLAIRYDFPTIINELFEQFERCHIWDRLPSGIDDLFEPEEEKSNEIRRCELIADLAGALIKSHSYMHVQQMVDILNQNNITTNRGDKYTKGGRGIYKAIKAAWDYYQYTLKDEQTAYNIALSFVDSKGGYAYDNYE